MGESSYCQKYKESVNRRKGVLLKIYQGIKVWRKMSELEKCKGRDQDIVLEFLE